MTRDRHIRPNANNSDNTITRRSRHYKWLLDEIDDLLRLQIQVIDKHQRRIGQPNGEELLEEIKIRALALLYNLDRIKHTNP